MNIMILFILFFLVIISWVGDKYKKLYYKNLALEAENLSLKLENITIKIRRKLK